MRSATPIEIRQFETEGGRAPFREWRRGLKDPHVRHRVDARLSRVRDGNLGGYRDLGGGLSELRLVFGPWLSNLFFAH